jgi:hypothetical protein
MALDAERNDVLRMVVGAGLPAIGMAVRLAGALFVTRVLKTSSTVSNQRMGSRFAWCARFCERRRSSPAICRRAGPRQSTL